MRVLVAGASGAVGRPLVAALNAHGHAVTALTRDPKKADLPSRLGAQPLLADVLDSDATAAAVLDVRSEVVVDQLTALPSRYTPETMRAALADAPGGADRRWRQPLRSRGRRGARRYVAESGCYYYSLETGWRTRANRGCNMARRWLPGRRRADRPRAAHGGP